MDLGEVAPGRSGGREWIGLAVIALHQCGMSRDELRAILDAGEDESVRRIWSCAESGWAAQQGADAR